MYSIGNPRNQVGNRGGMQPIGNPGRNEVLASMLFGGLPPPDPRAPPGSRNALAQALPPSAGKGAAALQATSVPMQQPPSAAATAPRPVASPADPAPPGPAPYNDDVAQALAAPDFSPAQTSFAALARVLGGGIGTYMGEKNRQADEATKQYERDKLARAVAGLPPELRAIARVDPKAAASAAAELATRKPEEVKRDVGSEVWTVSRDGRGSESLISTAPRWQEQPDKPQPGYMFGPPGTGETFIPGGSADPATIAAQDAARNPFILQQVYNPATNSMDTVAVPRQQVEQSIQQAQGGQAVVGSKPVQPTQDQTNAAGFADRLTSANAVLGQFEQQGGDALAQFLGGAPGGNYLVSPEWQQFDQARRDFVNAVLRRESGAAIGQQEFDNAARQYFPVPGDSPQVIAQKRQARDAALMNMTRAAGPGYQPAQTPATRPRGANDIDFNTLPPELQQQILQQRGGGR
jgi:hypothetical protein